jgi:hypothetical protein
MLEAAHENDYPFRHGVWTLEDEDAFFLYDCRPQVADAREEELSAVREWLAEEGLKELAFAVQYAEGSKTACSYGLVVVPSVERLQSAVWNGYGCVLEDLLRKLAASKHPLG